VQISRRDLFRSTAAVGGAAALGAGSLSGEAVAGSGTVARAGAGASTTRRVVLAKGAAGDGGWRPVVVKPGEDHVVRDGLGIKARKGRRKRRKPLLAFAQLSDLHILDAQSPMRLEFGENVSGSAYRPQEMVTGQVADAMVRRINEVGVGPVTGKPLALAIQTGDNSDTGQYNELRWNIDVLDGGVLTVDSGDPTRYEGVMDGDPAFYDPTYWHPEGTPEGLEDDEPRSQYGFPVVPGLLDAARAPFDAEGLSMRWYTAMGNHDGLVQGNFTMNDALRAQAVGTLKQTSRGPRTVTADPDRRLLSRREWVEEHFTTTGTPVGHGFTQRNRTEGTAYYSFDQGLVRFVVLDTVAEFGEKGAMDRQQFRWLQQLLESTHRKLVVLASHHPLSSFLEPDLADRIKRELLKHTNVVAWVNGHTHSNHIWAHKRKGGGGFWEINTASHIDWPQQARFLEISDNKDGTLSIFTTMVDHDAPVAFDFSTDLTDPAQATPARLAALGRVLAANDWQERTHDRLGARRDRNTELILEAPAFLR
jgi:metallophosphoesterase (TIGR03767 family)